MNRGGPSFYSASAEPKIVSGIQDGSSGQVTDPGAVSRTTPLNVITRGARQRRDKPSCESLFRSTVGGSLVDSSMPGRSI
jgi:hypothetical protein